MDGEREGFTPTAVASLTPARRIAMAFLSYRAQPYEMAQAAVFAMFVAALAFVPFWYGSNVPMAWGINAVIFPGLVLAFEIAVLTCGVRHPVAWRVIALPFIGAALVFTFIVVQGATWTPRVFHHPIWDMASEALGRPLPGSISVNRELTMQALLRFVTAASVFWLALQLGRSAVRAYRMLTAIASIVTAYAAWGLLARSLPPMQPGGGYVVSTFYNRNHFATYAGIGLIVSFGLLIRQYRSALPQGAPLRLRVADFIDITGKAGALTGSAAAIIAAALTLTGSRGAIVSALAGCLVLSFLTFGRRSRSSGEQLAVVGLFGLLVAVVFVVFGDTFFGKIEHYGFGDESRLAIYRLTAGSILNAPTLGHGYGTFADVFPMIRDRSVDVAGIWTAAHNSYLDIYQGLGLIFGSLLILSLGLLVMTCLSGAATRKADAAVPAIAAAVACLAALNALVDFSLEIQAVTLTFFAILGTGVAQAASSRMDLRD